MNRSSATAPRLVAVHATSDHQVHLQYEDGTTGTVELSPEIAAGGVFAELADPERFRTVRRTGFP